ncbi:MAG: hypothetical protein OEW75_13810, partial [Cyclobacteriaceae bacterium]|nr:hypothetical protein [Cyclobacteriaceae bacterium]
MNLFIKNILIIIFINVLSATCYSQEKADTLLFKIETQDGNTFIGNKIAEDENTITLMTENYGKLEIKKVHIKSVKPIENESLINGQYWGENVQDARYFWAPNGYGLQKGEG